jgi:teichuronic acid biosynthesis glycosyltransferase TuaG
VGLVLPMTKLVPAVSIITPYRDALRFLPGLVATLQAQTYSEWECLLVDHASTDGGDALAVAITAADPRFHHLREPDPRPLPALPRNRALAAARGQLICFLDVDDLWHPQKLERQLAFHCAGGLELSVTAYGRFSGDDSAFGTYPDSEAELPRSLWRRCPPAELKLHQLWLGNPIPMLTVMANRSLLATQDLTVGPFASVRHEDYLLWLQLWQANPRLRYGCLPEILAFHRRHEANLTAQRWRSLMWWYRLYRCAGASNIAAMAGSGRAAVIAVYGAVVERI